LLPLLVPNDPSSSPDQGGQDVIGYHDAREITNSWEYAPQFVLQDDFDGWLTFGPHLPAGWSRLSFALTVRGQVVEVNLS
jgi:trehalose/maltose hydrolase-like predicted phosphorylase